MSDKKSQKQELKTVGDSMPIGIRDTNGVLHKGFAFRPWRLKEEKELGELKEDLKDATMPEYVNAVLSTMCTKLGPHDFTSMDSIKKKLVISQMYAADVFFVYIKLRMATIGNTIRFDVDCPYCNKHIKIIGELETIGVKCADTEDELRWDYDLSMPIKLRGKEVKKLKFNALQWSNYEALTEKHQNEGMLLDFLLSKSVCGSDAHPDGVILVEDELDELVRADYTAISKKMTESSYGPDMAIETKCPKCKNDIFLRIEWEKQSFFDDSSL